MDYGRLTIRKRDIGVSGEFGDIDIKDNKTKDKALNISGLKVNIFQVLQQQKMRWG